MIFFVFRKNDGSMYERMVSLLTGMFVHVDLVLDNKAYSAYVNETFSVSDIDLTNPLYTVLGLELAQEEENKIREWVTSQVENKTPYNYSDLYHCVVPIPPFTSDTQPSTVKHLFCSQACILALRLAVTENEDLKNAIAKVNSRTCTPNHLFRVLKPFCELYK